MKLVDRMLEDEFASTLDEHGVTRRQWQLMNVLSREPATLEQLDAAIAPLSPDDGGQTAADHLAELVDSEWLVADGGSYALTERGRGALDRLSAVVAAQRTAMMAGISEGDYTVTVDVLERMARNLGWNE